MAGEALQAAAHRCLFARHLTIRLKAAVLTVLGKSPWAWEMEGP